MGSSTRSMKSWAELTPTQRERLVGLILTLREFTYGYNQSFLISMKGDQQFDARRFYSSSLYQYFANLFLVKGNRGAAPLLREIGSNDLVTTIDVILSYKYCEHDLRYILRGFRDKQLVHTSFASDELEKHLGDDIDLGAHVDSILMSVADLFTRTRDLHHNLIGRFPELIVDGGLNNAQDDGV